MTELQATKRYKDLELQKLEFNHLVVSELLHLFSLHEQKKISRDQLMHYFREIEQYDWALEHEVFDIIVLAALGKIQNDSYYRAIKQNLQDLFVVLKKQLPDEQIAFVKPKKAKKRVKKTVKKVKKKPKKSVKKKVKKRVKKKSRKKS